MALRITAILGLDGTRFEQGMKRADATASRFAHNTVKELGSRLAGIFAVGSMVHFSRQLVEMSDRLIDMSRRLGVSVEWLQEMQFATKHAGTDIDVLARAMENLGSVRLGISTGKMTAQQKAALAQFGMTPEGFLGMTNEQTISAIGAAMKGKNAQQFEGAMRALGGRGAAALSGMFVAGVDDARAEARNRGQVLAGETVAQLKAYGEEISIFAKRLAVEAAPILLSVFRGMIKGFYGFKAWWAGYSAVWKAGNPGMNYAMNITPGFGGYTKQQKELIKQGPPDEQMRELRDKAEDAVFAEMDKFFAGVADMVKAFATVAPRSGGFTPAQVASNSPAFKASSDALVAVGNFLGTNRTVLESLANRQVSLLSSIDSKMSDVVENTAGPIDDVFDFI